MRRKAVSHSFALSVLGLFSLSAADARATVLVVKTRDSTGTELRRHFETTPTRHWSGTEIGNGARFVERAFPGPTWGAPSRTNFPGDHYFVVGLEKGADFSKMMTDVAALASVESVQPDYELSDPAVQGGTISYAPRPSDPRVKDQWYLGTVGVTAAWGMTSGEGTSIADVESGFDLTHPDLIHQVDRARSHDYDLAADDPEDLDHGIKSHGTPVAGILVAEAGNGLFGAGIAFNSRLIASQMAATYEDSTYESVWTVNTARAILGSVDEGASVILVEKQVTSLYSSVERVSVIHDAIRAATAAGVTVIVPAGNFGGSLEPEAKLPDSGSVVVAASDQSGRLAAFSNYGARANVSAPGENIYSIQQNNSEISNFGGTSAAAAIVAGIAALIRSVNPRLSPQEVRQVLVDSGKPLSQEVGMSSKLPVSLLPGFSLPLLASRVRPNRIAGPIPQADRAINLALHFQPST